VRAGRSFSGTAKLRSAKQIEVQTEKGPLLIDCGLDHPGDGLATDYGAGLYRR
jgi:hypothetical protein